MALVSGTIVWSYEVGAKISASIYCQIFDVDDDHMDNYPRVLTAKIPAIILMMIITPFIIPNNQKILKLAGKLRKQHQEKQSLKRQIDTRKLRQQLSNEKEEHEGGEQSSSHGHIWAAQRYVMSIFNLSNSEISYQSIKNLDNEEEEEEEIDPEEERDMMGEEAD